MIFHFHPKLRYYLETPPLSYDFKIPTCAQNQDTFSELPPLNCGFEIPTYAQNRDSFPELPPLNCSFEIPASAKNRDTFPNRRRSVMNFRFHPKTGN
jgi:hypothetical protein